MRKILVSFATVAAAMTAVDSLAQTYVWKDGAVILRMESGTPDSITFVDPMARNYVSVGEGRQVIFSPGNLQYLDSEPMWRFASKQYEVVGTGNIYRQVDELGYVSNWIDLFGWASTGWSNSLFGNAIEPVETSTDYKDYLVDNNWQNSISDYSSWADWGCNDIDGYGKGWRTLTSDEWNYIFFERDNAASLFALATVAERRGLIILPDAWETPKSLTFTPSSESRLKVQNGLYIDDDMTEDNFADNVYDEKEWARMEGAGAIFLPAAGRRWGAKELKNFGWADWGVYWSSTTGSQEREGNVRALSFYISGVTPRAETSRAWGASVRLVRDKK